MDGLEFVFAQEGMLPAIVEIYNQSIPCRYITGDLEPIKVEERKDWFNFHIDNQKYPL